MNDILNEDDRETLTALDDRRYLVNLDFEPFDDSDSEEDVAMFEPGDVPE